MSITPLIYKTVERKAIEKANKKVEHAERMLESFVSQLSQQVEYRYDEHGNYIKETKTQKTEIEIITKSKKETEAENKELKYQLDSIQLRKTDIIPELTSIKIGRL